QLYRQPDRLRRRRREPGDLARGAGARADRDAGVAPGGADRGAGRSPADHRRSAVRDDRGGGDRRGRGISVGSGAGVAAVLPRARPVAAPAGQYRLCHAALLHRGGRPGRAVRRDPRGGGHAARRL
ncbi:hypothetical protein LTR94_028455, partial [Friedmanniomyces endolithicus]